MRVGPLLVGVRAETASLATALRSALGGSVVEGAQAPPNYSVRVEGRGRAARYLLYRATCLVLRTRSRERLAGALVACLRAHRGSSPLLRLRRTVVLSESGVLVLPSELFHRVEGVEGALREAGLRLAEPPFAVLDPESGVAVLEAEARCAPVRFWGLLRRERGRPVARSEALAEAIRQASRDVGVPGPRALLALARALSEAEVGPVWYEGGRALVERLVEAAASSGS
ncbi:MAG TPA: hypothetical protein VNO34_03465 [Actinomycetota bacterium]|nr:hypothetical protein [Actinomycetota bacterium]